jgi:formylglycine-generating enzyme required for sulfatase activity/photosystem II stability/assembly factor-like uncharacterized protein
MLLIAAASAYCQTWDVQMGAGSAWLGVSFPDANHGCVVGQYGSGHHTSDGGSNWIGYANFGWNWNLIGVSFISADTGWIVGELGAVFHTTNGGEDWTAQTSTTSRLLRRVTFVDANYGYAVGDVGTIIYTSNGGTTWATQTSGTTKILRGVAFADAQNGWAVGDSGTIRHTTDGGSVWTAQPSATGQPLYGVTFVDTNNGWVVGANGTIRRTTNGGASWQAQTSGTTNHLYNAAFVDVNTGWVVGTAGTILKTADGGLTWSAQTSGTAQGLYDVSFADAYNGWAAGGNGTILHYSAPPPQTPPPSPSGLVITAAETDVRLDWNPSDSTSEYCIYAGDSNNFPISSAARIGSTLDTNFTHVNGLELNKRFYVVVANSNQPPAIPSSPYPPDRALLFTLNVEISWTCSDPDLDALSYDVYFGSTSTPPLVVSGQAVPTYHPGQGTNGETYYWRIVAHDTNGHSTSSPVWSYETVVGDPAFTMALVPSGTYIMGATYSTYSQPMHNVNVPAFYIDIYKVSNSHYKAFCDSTDYAYPPDPAFPDMPNYFTDPAYASYPVVNVNWQDAKNYAAWAGKRLPTEAEWERAAKGDADQRLWPWGTTWVPTNANVSNNPDDGYLYTSPISHYIDGTSPHGCFDMAGNVYDWCEDDWHSSYTGAPTDGSAWIDSPRATSRIMRGGQFGDSKETARSGQRGAITATTRRAWIGFRCAKSL